MKWYVPSWHGDLSLVPDENDSQQTQLLIVAPTVAEQKILDAIGAECIRRGWVDEWKRDPQGGKKVGIFRKTARTDSIVIGAPLEDVGPVVAKLMRPGPAVLTAVRFKDGTMETCSGGVAELTELAHAATAMEKTSDNKKAVAAATVKRPTPSCPDCVPGSVGPAREVLLAFLTPDEHDEWASRRTVTAIGGLSGHRYVIAHRHTVMAQQWRRICLDADTGDVVHFHDWSVPPEEEVLAAKLILEHREPWLRNEATLYSCAPDIYKNPFGDARDGTWDAGFCHALGQMLAGFYPDAPVRKEEEVPILIIDEDLAEPALACEVPPWA